ncbi:Rieske 2Fe-2S domain-containing protein [Wenzhouxiangella sp. AB-CW3]|uniref:Rieske (2Fe-2S) protein n=1 Tax=Wenzhouxiangella sp. AB-CW3 TaxID=2771012 RepID=UPI00168B4D03|nr:Rieske 2Fe-2S domain-containing protein [Wenzhouxiangella sp. AB-CW3]QOC22161.1 Rieske 2Fe-2S domain-containing protein [Wenzhouxiangella sp. AB-CW3]
MFLCQSDELSDGRFREFTVETDDETVYLVATRHQGQPRAWYNVCPHQGRALNFAPDRFLTDDHGHLVCCAHGAVFEPDRGRCISGPCENAELKAVTLAEDNGRITVSL